MTLFIMTMIKLGLKGSTASQSATGNYSIYQNIMPGMSIFLVYFKKNIRKSMISTASHKRD